MEKKLGKGKHRGPNDPAIFLLPVRHTFSHSLSRQTPEVI
jgi:hypothetical protein